MGMLAFMEKMRRASEPFVRFMQSRTLPSHPFSFVELQGLMHDAGLHLSLDGSPVYNVHLLDEEAQQALWEVLVALRGAVSGGDSEVGVMDSARDRLSNLLHRKHRQLVAYVRPPEDG